MQGDNGLNNPLDVDDLLSVHAVYRTLTSNDKWFDVLPKSPSWIRWNYLDEYDNSAVGAIQFQEIPLISIHREAFKWNDPIILEGVMRHELLHLVLGSEEGHGAIFTSAEGSWSRLHQYQMEKKRFFRNLHAQQAVNDEYVYECPACEGVYRTKRPLSPDSCCRECCISFNDGKWCESYILIRVGLSSTHHERKQSPHREARNEANQ